MKTYIRTVATAVLAAVATGTPLLARADMIAITNREGLVAITNYLAGTYALDADIDLGGADWTPVGNDSAPFTGSLYGNGYAIRNLVCTNNPSGNSSRGLFGCISNATIKCVSVSGTVAGKQYVGGLVGRVGVERSSATARRRSRSRRPAPTPEGWSVHVTAAARTI